MKNDRYQSWMIPMMNVQQVNASPLSSDELIEKRRYGEKLWFYETLKGLARLEVMLCENDKIIGDSSMVEIDPDNLESHIALSQLWIFGAYELIRTFRDKIGKDHVNYEEIKNLLNSFEEVRVPLAKFEVQRKRGGKNKMEENYAIARPGFKDGRDIGWFIGEETFITRMELSEKMRVFFLNYKHYKVEMLEALGFK